MVGVCIIMTIQKRSLESVKRVLETARSIGWIFGANTRVIPPVDVAYSNKERHVLVVRFDEDGKVIDYTYDRTETPSKRVY